MEVTPVHPLIDVSQEDMTKIRQFHEVDDVRLFQDSLDQIEEWFKKQPHLEEAHKYMPQNMVVRMFILANGSLEGTKKRIDKLVTSRGMMPELSLNRTNLEFSKYLEIVNYIPLPKLNPVDQSRVMITQFLTDKLDGFNLLSHFRYCFMVGEYRAHFDNSVSERYIVDLNNFHIGVLAKFNPIVVKKAEVLCIEGCGTKIKGIHILNAPPFVDRFVSILKQAFREKVASRLHVHPTYSDLHKHIPKAKRSCQRTMREMDLLAPNWVQWRETFRTEEAQKIIKNLDKLISDETRRQSAKFNEEYMGMPGSFRKLNVD